MIAKWFTSVRVFFVWLLGFVLALIILALGHELFMLFIVNTLKWGKYTVRFMNNAYYAIAGIVCVAYYILIHDYLSRHAKKGQLLKSSLQAIGSQLLIVGVIQACLVLYAYYPADWQMIGLFVLELLVGAAMLFFARVKKKPLETG
jgi:hypothetical protein